MNNENLKFIDEFKEKDRKYEQALMNLEDCIKNVYHSTTQTSINLARIRLWLEIDNTATKLEDFKYIDSDILYAFCCGINFRKWAIRFKQHSQKMSITEDEDLFKDNEESDFDEVDNRAFNGIIHGIKHYNSIAEETKDEILSEDFKSSLVALKNICDSGAIKDAIAFMLWEFSRFLDTINQIISTPPLDCMSNLYSSFANVDDDNHLEFRSFLEEYQDNPNFLYLINERMNKFFTDKVMPYCADKDIWRDLFEWEPLCQPSYEKIGDYIWKIRDKKDKIESAINIVSLTKYWCSYNNIIQAYTMRNRITSPDKASDNTQETKKLERSIEANAQVIGQNSPSNNDPSFVINTEMSNMVIGKLRKLMDGKAKPKDVIMPIRAAIEAGVIRRPTWKEFCSVFGNERVRSKSSLNDYTDPRSNKYIGEAFDKMVIEFRSLTK